MSSLLKKLIGPITILSQITRARNEMGIASLRLIAVIFFVVDADGSIKLLVCVSRKLRSSYVVSYRPLGSVWLDHVGVHRITVEAQYGGKCSSNIVRYQYL